MREREREEKERERERERKRELRESGHLSLKGGELARISSRSGLRGRKHPLESNGRA